MKKNINKLALIGLFVIFGLTACDQENDRGLYDTSLAPAYSMYQPALVAELIPENNGKIGVVVSRTDASQTGECQVKLTSTAPSTLTLFTLSSTKVSFAAGEYESRVDINFVLNDLSTTGTQYRFNLEFDGGVELSKGANAKTDITASRKLTWERKAGSYVSAAFGGTYSASIDRAVESPNMFRLANFFENIILFSVDKAAGTAVIPSQDLGEDIFGAGSSTWISCSKGTYANGVVTFGGGVWDNAFFTSSAMSSGLRMTSEQIILPDEFK